MAKNILNKRDMRLLYEMNVRLEAIEKDIPERNQWRKDLGDKIDKSLSAFATCQVQHAESSLSMKSDIEWLKWGFRGLVVCLVVMLGTFIGIK